MQSLCQDFVSNLSWITSLGTVLACAVGPGQPVLQSSASSHQIGYKTHSLVHSNDFEESAVNDH
jgi:hypothetical protein